MAQFADERSKAIRVKFVTGEVQIFSSSVETGESEETVPSQYEGPELDIGFNAQYLLDFLRAIAQNEVAFELKDPKSAGELRPGRRRHQGSVSLRSHAHEDLNRAGPEPVTGAPNQNVQ